MFSEPKNESVKTESDKNVRTSMGGTIECSTGYFIFILV